MTKTVIPSVIIEGIIVKTVDPLFCWESLNPPSGHQTPLLKQLVF